MKRAVTAQRQCVILPLLSFFSSLFCFSTLTHSLAHSEQLQIYQWLARPAAVTSHSFQAFFCDCGLSQDFLYIYLNLQQPAFCCLFSTFLKVGKKSVRAKCTTEYRFNSHHFAGFAVKSKTLKSKLWHVYYAWHWHRYTFFFNGNGNFPN